MHGRFSPMTPAGLQSLAELARRRRVVVCVNVLVYAALLSWLASILGTGGWSPLRVGVLIAFAIAAPWSVLGVCNAAIGFWLLHLTRDGLERVAPFASDDHSRRPLASRVAMLLTLRNEDAARAFARFRAMKADLDQTGAGAAFDWFVLSDTNDPLVAKTEEAEFLAWRATEGVSEATRLHYRRRGDNLGYKAGNIRDFCERWGEAFEFMIPLDADSLMDGETVLGLVRIGEAHPQIGILQSLVVGAPSRSAFARIFQFGMRHGMRSYTLGAAWWAGDCGPYWGHNALVRVTPFARYCVLPKLENDRHILSHDQIEAALMRAADYEVRVLPVECGSYEENPPTLIDFARRDLRWCEGNLQYIRLLGLPGLLVMSRIQLIWAISMFIGAPAWTSIIALGALIGVFEDTGAFPTGSAACLYVVFLSFFLAPKLFGFLDVALTNGGLARYGGTARFFVSAAIETVSSFIIGGVTTLNTTTFLLLGRKIGWSVQSRDAHDISISDALRAFWSHLAFGLALFALGGAFAPTLLLWSMPLTLGYIAAMPFALCTAAPTVGLWVMRRRLCSTPEELSLPRIFRGFAQDAGVSQLRGLERPRLAD